MIEGAHLEKGVLDWGLPRGVFHWLSQEIHANIESTSRICKNFEFFERNNLCSMLNIYI